jgi:hypothetical protein
METENPFALSADEDREFAALADADGYDLSGSRWAIRMREEAAREAEKAEAQRLERIRAEAYARRQGECQAEVRFGPTFRDRDESSVVRSLFGRRA